MKQSKTKLIVAIIAIVVVIIAIVAGVMLYLTTDLFKGNDQLFFKYLLKNNEMIEQFAENNTKTLVEDIKQDKYTTNSEITFNLESNDTKIANQAIPASNFSVKTKAIADPKNSRASSETTLKFLDKDLFTLKYLKNDDLYALKSDEVVNKYLAFENNNLKEFMEKLGVTDTSAIPNKIEPINLEELLFINEQDKKEILEKYMQVINVQIPKEKYKSEKNVTTTVNDKSVTANAYSLELARKRNKGFICGYNRNIKNR